MGDRLARLLLHNNRRLLLLLLLLVGLERAGRGGGRSGVGGRGRGGGRRGALVVRARVASGAAHSHRRRSRRSGRKLLLDGGLAHLGLLAALEALLAPQVAAVLEHAARVGVQGPEAPLAGLVGRSGHFDEAIVEGQRVAD